MGRPFLGTRFSESTAGSSTILSILGGAETDQLSNYPNPFGRTEKETRFVFYMDQTGRAELKIYTLLGGLVYSASRDNMGMLM